ncbi:DedA family protein [Heliobacterium chlorum]|uniref:DedA family protein n=1 Tax=Heliobacterium chlorum TaxID=2698 RepID=A0ABR7SYT0_HELCL|nr:DedA family protein [Heliobacterium chlorum]MBC9783180.1 DedA family protein [Heliobacterium chlorum]
MHALKDTAHWIVSTYGDVGLFLGLLFEFLGAPFPGEIAQAFAGFLISQDRLQLQITLLACVAGSQLGSMVAHVIGTRYGQLVLYEWAPRMGLKREHIERTESWFRRNRITMILFSRWIIGVRHVTPYFTGLVRMGFWETFFWNLLGSILWCTPIILIGVAAGEAYEAMMGEFHHYVNVLVLAGLLVFGAAYLLYRYRNAALKKAPVKSVAERIRENEE